MFVCAPAADERIFSFDDVDDKKFGNSHLCVRLCVRVRVYAHRKTVFFLGINCCYPLRALSPQTIL